MFLSKIWYVNNLKIDIDYILNVMFKFFFNILRFIEYFIDNNFKMKFYESKIIICIF